VAHRRGTRAAHPGPGALGHGEAALKLERKRDPAGSRRTGIVAARRPAHLLSGLIRCGACGGSMSLVGGTSCGCSTARDKRNRRTIKRRELEAVVLDGLKEQLMAPEAVKEFVVEFHREVNRLTADRRAVVNAGRRELEKVEREIRAIVEAIKAGGFSTVLNRELAVLEARHAQLTAQSAASALALVAIHPNASRSTARRRPIA
jgi:site-specific DNA recombinase